MYQCKYFRLNELVSPGVYAHFGIFAWKFLNQGMLRDLDLLRELWGKPIIINNYAWGGSYKESGLRCNTDSIVKAKKTPYLSAHCLGLGFDIKPEYIKDLPDLIKCVQTNYHKFTTISRMENPQFTPSWLHLDGLGDRENHLIIFNP